MYQWNILTLFNLVKAERKFINQHPKYLTTQILNSKPMVYFLKNGFLNFLSNTVDIRTLYLPEEYFYIRMNKKEIEKKILSENQLKKVINKITKKRMIFLNLTDQIKYKLNLY